MKESMTDGTIHVSKRTATTLQVGVEGKETLTSGAKTVSARVDVTGGTYPG